MFTVFLVKDACVCCYVVVDLVLVL